MFNIRRQNARQAHADKQVKLFTGIVAAAFVMIPATAVVAQTTDTSTTTTVTTSPIVVPMTGQMSGSSMMMTPGSPDYAVLASPKLDYFSIQRARAYGLTEDEIADAYTLARETLQSLPTVLDRVEDGATFASLAQEWGVPLEDVYSPERSRDRIRDFCAAYESTGEGALRGHGQDWSGWVEWQSPAVPVSDLPMINGTGNTGVVGGATSTTTTTTVATPMTPSPDASTSTTITSTPSSSDTTTMAPSSSSSTSTTTTTTTPTTSDSTTVTTPAQ